MMSSKRGKRGRPKQAVVLTIRNKEQMHRTLDLIGVIGERPHINDVMERIMSRFDEEERQEMLAMAKRWRNGRGNRNIYGWPTNAMIYDCMGEDYPGFDEEELYDNYMSHDSRHLKKLNKKLFKRMNRVGRKGKKRYERLGNEDDFWENRDTMYRHGELEGLDDECNYEDPYKCIKFYDDIENEMSIREFYSLKEFDEFCKEHGYHVSGIDENNLVNNSVIHCCLDPISKEYGENEIVTDTSYGGLYWSVSEDVAKFEEKSYSLTD